MKFKSQVYTEASGSIGGVTYSHNRGGMYTRARAIPVDPGSAFQLAIRAIVAALTSAWNDTLTAAQRTAWETYAANVLIPDRLGEPRNIGGIGQYIRTNVPRLQGSLSRLDDGPTVFNLGEFTAPAIASVTAPNTASITFTTGDAWHAAGGAMYILASRGVNPTLNYFKGPYRFADEILSADTSPHSVTLPFAVAAGQKVFFQFRAEQPDGRISLPFRLGAVAA